MFITFEVYSYFIQYKLTAKMLIGLLFRREIEGPAFVFTTGTFFSWISNCIYFRVLNDCLQIYCISNTDQACYHLLGTCRNKRDKCTLWLLMPTACCCLSSPLDHTYLHFIMMLMFSSIVLHYWFWHLWGVILFNKPEREFLLIYMENK